MNQIVQASSTAIAVPPAQVNLSFRVATMDDVTFIDGLMKTYNSQLGFFRFAQIEGYIKGGWILIAEKGVGGRLEGVEQTNSLHPTPHTLPPEPVGFIASRDKYFKRDECGIVYLLCVKPGLQRKFIGAALLKEVFDRSPYGCRSYSCWCAQDIEANQFWENMGFVPLAYRNGAEKKGPKGPDGKRTQRAHIFWQKKIRGGDDKVNWWFPAKTEKRGRWMQTGLSCQSRPGCIGAM